MFMKATNNLPAYEYQHKGNEFKVSNDMKEKFNNYGVIIVRGLLDKHEVARVMESLHTEVYRKNTYGIPDGEGRKAHITLWNHPGDDVTGMVGRCEKVAGTCEELLGGEVYHYHTKLMGKPAHDGGSHLWHQDYGYWYENGCLVPDMMTTFIALDKNEKDNGCLQYLLGSSQCGRIEHHRRGGQFEADKERVEQIRNRCPLQFAELESGDGDAMFMHSNVLHSSNANLSDKRRWAMLCCYNRADNNPVKEHHHPRYTPLIKVKNEATLTCTKLSDEEGKSFMPLGVDKTALLEKN